MTLDAQIHQLLARMSVLSEVPSFCRFIGDN